jgi:membrane-bound serine protease (ClpP class)
VCRVTHPVRRFLFISFLSLWPWDLPAYGAAQAVLLEVQGSINPATTDYVVRGLREAAEERAPLAVLRLDTPGGLDSAMRDIIQAILSSPVPVASFVGPSGARAASAGTYILYASHVAAMAPGTNLGAATPIEIGTPSPLPEQPAPPRPGKQPDEPTGKPSDKSGHGGEDASARKRVNDAVAYIRSLAQLRGRNAEWAEKAVREAASLSAQDAVALGVVDLIASDVPELLSRLQGRKVSVLGRDQVLATQGLTIERKEPDWRNRVLAVITDPNVAYLLMILGLYGLIFEFANPGFILPGVAGAIALLLALYAFQLLPVNYAGLALILLGLAFMVAEAFMPSFGALGIGGIIAFVAGSLMLLDTGATGYHGIHWQLIGALAAVSALFLFTVLGLALNSRRRPVVSGREGLMHDTGTALEDFDREGRIRVHGEAWFARSDRPVRRGQKVRIIGERDLVLRVEPQAASEEEET